MSSPFVIVGGGLAAATAAEELRTRGHDGPIHLVAAEAHRPYQRPPLSKEYLTGSGSLDDVFAHPDGWEAEHGVTLHTGVAARRIGDHVVELADGTELPFAKLLLATGATPRPLQVPGADAHGVRTFRTLDDADALKAELEGGSKKVVLIGSGWIGMELAAAARGYGNDVTIVSRGRVPLAKPLGEELGLLYRRVHEEHGVVFRMDAAPTAFDTDADGAVTAVRIRDDRVPADLVLVALGVEPDTALAADAGLEIDHGILVDERLQTSAPDIVAAGDVANPFHPVLQARLRSEHWANAIAGGKVAASTMLGGDAVLDDIPYLYSDQYDVGMEYSGYRPLMEGAELVIRGDLAARELVAFWLRRDDRVVAGMNVNVWDVNEEVQRLIRDRVVVDRTRLADSSVELASLR